MASSLPLAILWSWCWKAESLPFGGLSSLGLTSQPYRRRVATSGLLVPWQLGYGVRKGTKAAVHAARLYLHNLDSPKALLKLDFSKAFNSIHRDKMFMAVLELAPRLFRFVHSAYSSPSTLFWGDKTIQSAEGVQEGDSLGPLLFCLTIHQLGPKLISEFQMFYLDDGTLGG